MKVQLALAAAIAQASAGHSDAVFPSNGAHVTYAIHATTPRGEVYDTTMTLAAGSAATIMVSAPGKGSASVALDQGGPSHMDRNLGMGFHLLEEANNVAQAGLSGGSTATVHVGPPNAEPATLKVSRSGNTFTATGTASFPPPPMGGPGGEPHQGTPPGGSPQGQGGNRDVDVRIVVTVANGKVVNARGEIGPKNDRGPHESWTIARK